MSKINLRQAFLAVILLPVLLQLSCSDGNGSTSQNWVRSAANPLVTGNGI